MSSSRVVLLNTSILTSFGTFRYRPIPLSYAQEIVQLAHHTTENNPNPMGPLLSAIGHESTAQILSELLEVPVPVNRIQYTQERHDFAVVFKLRGRPAEGKILTGGEIHSIGFDFGLLTMDLEKASPQG